jgi:hypothetical protein
MKMKAIKAILILSERLKLLIESKFWFTRTKSPLGKGGGVLYNKTHHLPLPRGDFRKFHNFFVKFADTHIVLFFILVAFACNNQSNNKADESSDTTKKTQPIKSIVRENDKTEFNKINERKIIINEILVTSPRYKILTKGLKKAVIKNGGQSFGVSLEACPNPGKNNNWGYSENYEFTVFETFKDRQLNIARFLFNPKSKQLYEYDVFHDKFIKIEFNRNLLSKLETLNK